MKFSRRNFMALIGSGLALSQVAELYAANGNKNFRVRTITAGVELQGIDDFRKVEAAVRNLNRAKQIFTIAGYEVQTLRLATQSLTYYMPDWRKSGSVKRIQTLDKLAAELGIVLSLGPVIMTDSHERGFANWAAEVIAATQQTSMTVAVASAQHGVHYHSIIAAAEAIKAISRSLPGGEGNFRFAASAFIPAGTPFFPAGYHAGKDSVGIGLETPNLLRSTFVGINAVRQVGTALKHSLETAFRPVENIAQTFANDNNLHYFGIDVSPAPGPDASIGQAIETLIGEPFGSASTLSACAAITDVLKNLNIKTCGYSGLMLPVVEDTVLARRAAEGHFSVSELLLYSSVCGTGLDVIPLAGDIPVEKLSSIIGDVAALAKKYHKPLSARLFPIPDKSVGDAVQFDNPFLTDSVVMSL